MNAGQLTGVVVTGAAIATAINVSEVNPTMAASIAIAGLSAGGCVALDVAVKNKNEDDEENR